MNLYLLVRIFKVHPDGVAFDAQHMVVVMHVIMAKI